MKKLHRRKAAVEKKDGGGEIKRISSPNG